MRKLIFAAVAAATTVALSAGSASAATFAFEGDYDVAYHQAGNGLTVQINPITPSVNGLNFDLDGVGDWTLIPLFKLYTGNEGTVNVDDTVAKPITVDFAFSAPVGTTPGSISGTTDGIKTGFFGAIQYGQLTWNDGGQQTFAFGDGGLLKVTLINFNPTNPFDPFGGTFNGGIGGLFDGEFFGVYVKAKFQLLSEPISPAPEPGAWALMIGGFGMAGAALRRRRAIAT